MPFKGYASVRVNWYNISVKLFGTIVLIKSLQNVYTLWLSDYNSRNPSTGNNQKCQRFMCNLFIATLFI